MQTSRSGEPWPDWNHPGSWPGRGAAEHTQPAREPPWEPAAAKSVPVSNNLPMQAAFPIVLFGSIVLFVILGVVSMFTRSNNLYDQIGQGGLSVGEDQHRGTVPEPGPGGLDGPEGFGTESRAEREREIRQMLHARSDRLVRQGRPPLDIDAELAKLEPPESKPGSHDPGLAAEVRQLVVARNERRRRQGQDQLDVEAEVRRTLAELDP
jgi:hypothetical protein